MPDVIGRCEGKGNPGVKEEEEEEGTSEWEKLAEEEEEGVGRRCKSREATAVGCGKEDWVPSIVIRTSHTSVFYFSLSLLFSFPSFRSEDSPPVSIVNDETGNGRRFEVED